MAATPSPSRSSTPASSYQGTVARRSRRRPRAASGVSAASSTVTGSRGPRRRWRARRRSSRRRRSPAALPGLEQLAKGERVVSGAQHVLRSGAGQPHRVRAGGQHERVERVLAASVRSTWSASPTARSPSRSRRRAPQGRPAGSCRPARRPGPSSTAAAGRKAVAALGTDQGQLALVAPGPQLLDDAQPGQPGARHHDPGRPGHPHRLSRRGGHAASGQPDRAGGTPSPWCRMPVAAGGTGLRERPGLARGS